MLGRLLSSLNSAFPKFFPERQFYHRSHGEVHFISLSGRTQFIYLVLTLTFLTWVGYASVNVVFKEAIIAEKEKNFVEMRKQFEDRIGNLEREYDEARSRLVVATDNFADSLERLERRHDKLRSILDQRIAMLDDYETHRGVHIAEYFNEEEKNKDGVKKVLMHAGAADGAGRRSRVLESSEENPVEAVTAALGKMISESMVVSTGGRVGLVDRVAALEARVETTLKKQNEVLHNLEEASQEQTHRAESILKMTGMDTDGLLKRYEGEIAAKGGPLIALKEAESFLDDRKIDPSFRRQLFRLKSKFERLYVLETTLTKLPLINPVNAPHRLTSTFGRRVDPFTKRLAFHSGLDMAGYYGAEIVAPADGVVKFAGRKGPYGKFLEIDHGNGLVTRYGHLNKIKVKKGDAVKFYQKVAEMGSTGRSTGPHLHYEVWFNKERRDPGKFIEAGSYVFKE